MAGKTRPPFRLALGYALRMRCPRCHKGRIFGNWLNKVLPACPNCGLPYYRESGYYLGGMILTYVFTAFTLLAIFFAGLLLPDSVLSENVKLALWVALAIALSLLFVRPAYSLWLAADFWIDPWETDMRKTGSPLGNRDSF